MSSNQHVVCCSTRVQEFVKCQFQWKLIMDHSLQLLGGLTVSFTSSSSSTVSVILSINVVLRYRSVPVYQLQNLYVASLIKTIQLKLHFSA